MLQCVTGQAIHIGQCTMHMGCVHYSYEMWCVCGCHGCLSVCDTVCVCVREREIVELFQVIRNGEIFSPMVVNVELQKVRAALRWPYTDLRLYSSCFLQAHTDQCQSESFLPSHELSHLHLTPNNLYSTCTRTNHWHRHVACHVQP